MTYDKRPPSFADAEARIVATWPSGAPRQLDFYRADTLLGRRFIVEDDPRSFTELELAPDGRRHGLEIRIDDGELVSVEPYANGLPHGLAEQWAQGELIGTYQMDRGGGLDLWHAVCCAPCWASRPRGAGDACRCHEAGAERKIYLAEARYLVDGWLHGFEYWIDIDQRSVHEERHFKRGQLHGIERVWSSSKKLRRGYPRYYVDGKRLDKRRYQRAAQKDASLPPFRAEDNERARDFPPEIARHLAVPSRRRRAAR